MDCARPRRGAGSGPELAAESDPLVTIGDRRAPIQNSSDRQCVRVRIGECRGVETLIADLIGQALQPDAAPIRQTYSLEHEEVSRLERQSFVTA
jgi:hypothetical protein